MHTADVEKNMSPVWVRAARIVNASDAFCTTSKISEMYFMRVFGASFVWSRPLEMVTTECFLSDDMAEEVAK